MKEKIYSIIEEIAPFEEITDETLLLEESILDSLTLVYLMDQIEEQLGIIIPEDNVKPENFSSIEKIVNMLSNL